MFRMFSGSIVTTATRVTTVAITVAGVLAMAVAHASPAF